MKKRAGKKNKSMAASRALSGSMDVIAIALISLTLIVLLLLLNSLVNWLRQDTEILFADLGTSITDAVLVR